MEPCRAGRYYQVDEPFLGRHQDNACCQELRDRSPVEDVFSLTVRLNHSPALDDSGRRVVGAHSSIAARAGTDSDTRRG